MCSLAVLQAEPKAVGLPPGAEMQPGKQSLGGEELIDGWRTVFAAGVWCRNQESEQCPGLRECGKRAGVCKRGVGVMTSVKIIHMLSTVRGILYLPTIPRSFTSVFPQHTCV